MSLLHPSQVIEKSTSEDTLSFQRTVRARQAFRRFLSTPVPDSTIRDVLEDAQFTPSNCNTQPWAMHIVSGDSLSTLSKALLNAHNASALSLDFSFDTEAFSGAYKQRQIDQGRVYYKALGVEREDKAGRAAAAVRNYQFFDAPHAAFLFMPAVGDNVRVASDVGMYAQTFLLSLTAHGLGGVPQTTLGFFADTVREVLEVESEFKLLFGVSFGYPDREARENSVHLGRDDIDRSVTFHG